MCVAEIITIGDEILIGQILDSNSAWIAKQLNLVGISVKQISSVSDDKSHIITALSEAEKRADLILVTGGLGPTKDDITKDSFCEYFGSELVLNSVVLKRVEGIFKHHNRPILDSNRKQAEVPNVCEVLDNKLGTAPGMLFRKKNKVFVSMPGVPYEMKGLMNEYVLPLVLEEYVNQAIIHRTILTQGVGESILAEKLKEWENSLVKKHVKLAYLPSPGMVRLRLSMTGNNKAELASILAVEIATLYEQIPKYIYGEENQKLEAVIGEILVAKNKSISTAESCTGGLIGQRISSVPGSSRYYVGSIVAYNNSVKNNLLHVLNDVIEKNGAVSEEVAILMAENIRKSMGSDYGISTTGIAGPDGGSEDKPVGTVWIGFSSNEKTFAKSFYFGSNRMRNVEISTLTALNILRVELIESK